MTEHTECVVIGAGVVGLAVGRACARAGLETIVVEAAEAIGTATSSRNSEVIHAGIYYQPGSLKARLCVQGRELLYAYCDQHEIAYQRCGKLIVATDKAQVGALRQLAVNAAANGVSNLRLMTEAQARRAEPALRCAAALESPSTGIVDSHGFMIALQGDIEAAGGLLAFCSPVTGGAVASGEGIILCVGGTEPMQICARYVVNCAGLHAWAVAAAIDGVPHHTIPEYRYAKGNYYSLSTTAPFSRLIYPVPEPGGLGVHLTLDLGGRARFGPDVEWVDTIDYSVDPARADAFYESIRRYWPELPDAALHPDYAGIRPKLIGLSDHDADFVIQGEDEHGVAGLVNLYGIESPGLTAALAIAEDVMRQMPCSQK
ncbi:NAD(P)/FAD-dependent oxidoreductase [Alcaligenaceae bacterium CGII-47]|nr:NAD(P)/FAD-dependent oxidoreductase [Alcaligenaceae bacterium CGII-47]